MSRQDENCPLLSRREMAKVAENANYIASETKFYNDGTPCLFCGSYAYACHSISSHLRPIVPHPGLRDLNLCIPCIRHILGQCKGESSGPPKAQMEELEHFSRSLKESISFFREDCWQAN